MKFTCETCGGKTELVHETAKKLFFKCLDGHPKKGEEYKEHPVFMVEKDTA